MLGRQSSHNPDFQKSSKSNALKRFAATGFAATLAMFTPIAGVTSWANDDIAAAQTVVKTAEAVPAAPTAVSETEAAKSETAKSETAAKKASVEPLKPAVDTPVKIVNTTLIAEVDSTIKVTLDGETLESTEVHRTEKGALYVNAQPIFTALNNDFEYDDVSKALIVRRSQDGVVMELYTDTGIVKQNGKALGKLKHFGEVSQGRYILTPNAIAVLSGANGRFNDKTKEFSFKLDPRLKVATGFDIFVNGVSLGNLNPAPKSVGPVLMLPLLPIAEALGHDVRVLDSSNEVFVRRAQDSAEFTLNLDTGLVKLRGVPYGITKDIAYIDPVNLLLPSNAIETLTGTHVSITGGSSRIEITLDERLAGAVKPMASVDDEAKNTPFTVETLKFHLGPDTINTVELDFRVSSINGRVRYETPDIPTTTAEIEPSWLSLEYAHINGVTGSIGDYSADNRELDGVGLRRIRGVAAQKVTDKGRWALVAGVPTQGGVRISEDQSRLTYGGFTAGARFASRDGWEAGAAVKRDNLSDDQMAVLSAISGTLGRKKDKQFQWDARVDLGVFDGPARAKPVDLRTNVSARYDVNKTITVDAFAQYDGVEFLRSNLDAEDTQDAITEALNPDALESVDEGLIPDTRRRGSDQLTVSSSLRLTPNKDLGFFKNPAASIRGQIATTGVTSDTENSVSTQSIGASVATSLGDTGVSLSVDANAFTQSFGDGREDDFGQGFSMRAYKQFDLATVRAQYQNSNVKGQGVAQSATVNISARSFNVPLPKEARLSVGPNVSASWRPEQQNIRGGVTANFNSGSILGAKTRLDASFGILQSVSGGSQARSQTDKYLSVSLARRLPVGKNMALGLAYRNDLNGNQRIGLQLDGRFDFNEKRKYRHTEDGRGVLKGRAFVDKNRDGIKQEDEPAVPNTLIRLKGTRMALRTDRGGFYTIQNIKAGLYDIVVDGRTLPLGYALSTTVQTRATIMEGQITDVPIPIVQRGQIRGFTYVDANGNAEFDAGEERVDSVSLRLDGLKDNNDEARTNAISTSFGQFAFDDLPDGQYTVRALSQPKLGLKAGKGVTVNLADYDRLLAKIAIPIMRETASGEPTLRLVEAEFADADAPASIADEPNTTEPALDGPAPP